MNEPVTQHWLAVAARRAGLDLPSGFTIPTAEPLVTTWQRVSEACSLSPDELAAAVAQSFRLKTADLSNLDRGSSRLLTEEIARKCLVIPVGQTDRTLFVATSNPTDFDSESEIRFISGRDTQFLVASPDAILEAINETWRSDHQEQLLLTNKALDAATAAVKLTGVAKSADGEATNAVGGPASKLTNLILFEAVRAGATAVLLEPQRNGGRVRIRSEDGESTLATLPRAAMARAADRIRGLAGYGTAGGTGERGRIDAVISGVPYSLRVSRTVKDGNERLLIHIDAPGVSAAASDPSVRASDSRPLVLVVDDDASARLLLRTVLEGSGFRVLEAEDGPPALALLADQDEVELVILDLMMPQMHGLDVLKEIRGAIKTVGLPVVVMTASEKPEDELELFEAGADDYLHKPVHPPRMIVRIRAVLRRSGVHVEH